MAADNNAEFALKKSFGIDDGELDGESPQQCFCLGYELATIDTMLHYERRSFWKPYHTVNRDRVQAACEASGRLYKFKVLNDDWGEIHVAPYTEEPGRKVRNA